MADQTISQTPLSDTSELSNLRNAMQQVLSADLQVIGPHRETLRELAEEFRFAIDVNAVKQLRNERNELPVASPIRSATQEVDGTPITELGLTPATLRKCQSQLVAHWDERVNRFTSVSQGIETIEQLASISLDALREQNFGERAIRDIKKNLAPFMANQHSELVGNQNSASMFPILLDYTDLISGFAISYSHEVIKSPATKAVLKEDIAFLPGVSAESVAWLKRIPLLETESDIVRNLKSVGDLVQIVATFPDNWIGFDALQVNNYLLNFGLTLGYHFDQHEIEELEIKDVKPVAPPEGYQSPLIKMASVFAMHN